MMCCLLVQLGSQRSSSLLLLDPGIDSTAETVKLLLIGLAKCYVLGDLRLQPFPAESCAGAQIIAKGTHRWEALLRRCSNHEDHFVSHVILDCAPRIAAVLAACIFTENFSENQSSDCTSSVHQSILSTTVVPVHVILPCMCVRHRPQA